MLMHVLMFMAVIACWTVFKAIFRKIVELKAKNGSFEGSSDEIKYRVGKYYASIEFFYSLLLVPMWSVLTIYNIFHADLSLSC